MEYSKLLKFFTKKDRTLKEVLNYLKKSGVSDSDSAFFISKLQSQNILNEDRYLENYIKFKIEDYWSKEKIKFHLIEKGYEENLIKEKFEIFGDEIFLEKLETLIQKKIKISTPIKTYSYLLKNGFREEEIVLLFKKLEITIIDRDYES